MDELPYRVTVLDPRTGQRREYGRASERTGAASLAASAKVQNAGYRDVRIEVRAAGPQEGPDGGWVRVS